MLCLIFFYLKKQIDILFCNESMSIDHLGCGQRNLVEIVTPVWHLKSQSINIESINIT